MNPLGGLRFQYNANPPMQYTVNFNCCKDDNFQLKYFFIIFLFFAQNIDCGYTLELPR